MSLPLIAIVGRPNVGKSTLFNRIVGRRAAITSPKAGTTRDRIYHEADIGKYRVIVIDTGGMEFASPRSGVNRSIEDDIQTQARIAVEEAHIIIFVVDAREQLTSSDLDCAQFLRKSKKPIILVANKADNEDKATELAEQIYELGLGDSLPVSSLHNRGIMELETAVEKTLIKMKWVKEKTHKKSTVHIGIVGKPNVGKSSLVNCLVGAERLIVSDIPGTTIDSTDTPFHFRGGDFVLIDTAGLRRRGKVGRGIEQYGVLRSLQSISRSDVACLVLDYGTGIANQDLHVSEYVLEAGKGLIIVVNKADLVENPEADRAKFLSALRHRMSFVPWAPVIFTSALDKKGVYKIFELTGNIAAERNKKIPDEDFMFFLKTIIVGNPPPVQSGKKIIIKKGIQVGVSPPTFEITANRPDSIHFSYRRYIENEIRRKFGFDGTAIRVKFIEAKY